MMLQIKLLPLALLDHAQRHPGYSQRAGKAGNTSHGGCHRRHVFPHAVAPWAMQAGARTTLTLCRLLDVFACAVKGLRVFACFQS